MVLGQLADLVNPQPVESLSTTLIGIFERLEVDEGAILEPEVQELRAPAGHPFGRDELLEGWNNVSMELRVGGGAGPADSIWNASLLDTSNTADARFPPPSAGDDGEVIVESLSVNTTQGAVEDRFDGTIRLLTPLTPAGSMSLEEG